MYLGKEPQKFILFYEITPICGLLEMNGEIITLL